jgi:hypothetical protein
MLRQMFADDGLKRKRQDKPMVARRGSFFHPESRLAIHSWEASKAEDERWV